jgi:dihydrofolate reductase
MTLKEGEWNNPRLIKDNSEEEVYKLKLQSGQAIFIRGSDDLVQTLMQNGLIKTGSSSEIGMG